MQQLAQLGYVVLPGVVDPAALDALRLQLEQDTAVLAERVDWAAEANAYGHLPQAMPPQARHIHRSIVANPQVVQVTHAMLGAGVHQHFYTCNTNMPGSGFQVLHRDAPNVGNDVVHPFVSVIVNVPLVDVDEGNGAIELWPGTHRIPGSTRIDAQAQCARADVVAPVRIRSRQGDVLLRDPRLWHRGMPNLSSANRHMIAMVHSRWYYQPGTTLPVTLDAVHAFDDPVLTTRVHVVPGDHDYLAATLR
ncbi:phytanoyl-CoA dioxygenase family protein [Pseudoxanthomonas koreensis]|uniref:phytanoyl-CoA dioxygenase family protein n=1 Tax=Pseudoxanthomonas koreensis TaxID=266061 RepID=UPI001390F47D|nr:phytanoyl-CoA dioxygenase family protein [Pseudoxanthomonas koreensis]